MLDRRKLLVVGGGVAGGAILVPDLVRGLSADATGHQQAQQPHHIGSVPGARVKRPLAAGEPFSVPMPRLHEQRPVSSTYDTDCYQVDIRPADVEILPGVSTPAFTYNGKFSGPTFRTRVGRRTKIVYRNLLDRPANVHLHGAHVPASQDGHPMDVIQPGQSRTYDYPNTQQGCTLWYHDHSHHTEAEHVYRGLNGFYIIDDPSEDRLGLPRGAYDVPILLRDALFDANGELLFGGNPNDRDVALANGKPAPYFEVDARKYRFRLLNAGTERTFNLTLGTDQEMTQIATDGGLLPAPVVRKSVRVSSAERVEIVIDFARYPVGTKLVLNDAKLGPVLRFDVTRTTSDYSRVPATLRPLPVLPAATVTRDVSMSFDLTTVPFPTGLINGRAWDPARSDFVVKRGTTEIWNVTNADPQYIFHTFHMHLVQFQVLEVNGAPPGIDYQGRKDTFWFDSGDKIKLKATFDSHLGKYAFHCHFLEHSSLGMMAQMEIVP
ncbi:Multicopper oxidase with three cupredoxin domains (includes cell division protein FtsP and spore coat protein CotA) [Actinokineospora alba]|uniref:Multicopper oxidase with three cupredoxin domains (Includes cell division protein FtsP and spore coat protein CotA) n=1 Tax=Actinokineospora alba TaxID=504798 RepID=A0A1H0HCU8_9PSEU|nr:multicopper oxidase family protein [Actinokineospora alba]TDP64937.1 FtsP/CotA-like multicopper oxidase with cupredoxin domain [Actinokineospora alba]SDH49803.1 Multicopper oxidase with three cupredoxin domains (includes cell division protein FtsP and spore coat protein CotA) [Actinokineospora alba]SDO16967.1 Multicopper oxidase with three cupredoxin domains (includes cell division protein FtsP and spore coat protein CotA) [Actinokineospora alba]